MRKSVKKIFVKRSNNTFIQLFRYVFVGGIAFFVDFGLFYFLTEKIKLYYIISATLSFTIALFVNYIISIYWVFTKSKSSNRKLEFMHFALIGVAGLLINVLLLWILTDKLNIYYLVSKIAAAVLVALWNFFARKYILFN